MMVSSGAFRYQQALRTVIQEVANKDATVSYPSGHVDKLDIAVRRSLLTGIGLASRQISEENSRLCGCDLMEISAHSGARPSHASWQVQIVSLSGRKGYLSKSDIGYGTGVGLGGWNCRHDWYPFYEEISKRNYSQKDLDKLNAKDIKYNGKMYSEYEISQMLRQKEREIRALKREQNAYKTAISEIDDKELKAVFQSALTYTNSAIRDKSTQIQDFCNQTGYTRDRFREQVGGKTSVGHTTGNTQKYRDTLKNGLTSAQNSGKLKSSNQENNQIQWLPKGEKLSSTQFKELRDYAKDKGVTIQEIKKSDVNIELIKEVIDESSKMLDKYPALKGDERKPFTISIESTMLNNDFGSTTPNITHIIELNENAFRNRQKLSDEYQKLLVDKWFAKGTSYKSIVVHEIGHLIGDIYNIDSLAIAKRVLNIDSTSKLLLKVKEELSTYASSFADGSEIISEVFSAFYTGDRNEFIDKFMEEVNKIVKGET